MLLAPVHQLGTTGSTSATWASSLGSLQRKPNAPVVAPVYPKLTG